MQTAMDDAVDQEREPAPGTGQVLVNWDGSGGWIGVWQNGPDHVARFGTRPEVLEWGRTRPAAEFWSCTPDGFVPWDLQD